MYRKRSQHGGWFIVAVTCAAAWIIGGNWIAAGQSNEATTPRKPRAASDHEWQPPVTVDNPFVARPTFAGERAAAALPPDASEAPHVDDPTLPIEGEVVDSNLPVIYRLPPVTPREPEPDDIPLPAPRSNDPVIESRLPDDVANASKHDVPPTSTTKAPPPETSPLPYAPRLAERRLFAPTSTELTTQLLPAVQRGCELAQRGALYAAQTEFIQVIRRIAQANDAQAHTDDHSRALADGLRALDEAADFVPGGTGLEGDLDVDIIASSHRTPLVRESHVGTAPHTAVALYHGFAQQRLEVAVGGQQAGSMALYGLGKVHARIAERNDDDVLSTRSAMTMYLAALAACPANHMAANELGVLLCRNGHPAEAARLFEQAIDHWPSATTYHNLAVAQQKLGFAAQAAANQREADRLAAWERSTGAVSQRAGVQWMSPNQFAQVAPPSVAAIPTVQAPPPGMPTAQNAPAPIPYTATPAAPKSPLQKAAAIAKSITLPSGGKTPNTVPAPRSDAIGPTAARTIPWF
jgi:hypothetical protein